MALNEIKSSAYLKENKVVRGKSGFLFQTDENIFGKLTGVVDIPNDWISQLDETMDKTRLHLAANGGGRQLLVVAPEKHVVYKEYLPNEFIISESRPARLITRQDVIYPLDLLLEQKPSKQTYAPGGTHWNGYGAFLVYREICEKLCVAHLEANDLEWIDDIVPGAEELADRLGEPAGNFLHFQKKISTGFFRFDNTIFSIGNVKVSSNKNSNLPSLVMFRDSFAGYFLSLFAESFSRIVAVATRSYLSELIESERPDFVITEIAERYLIDYPWWVPKGSLQEIAKMTAAEIKSVG